jgi:teichuronic acid biosynthesis glycosyltransferase TuaH
MEEKTLIFVPYQDSDNFLSDGILTREFAMLFLFWQAGYQKILNIKKPRTFLDKKWYQIKSEYYPKGTIEEVVKNILDESKTIQYSPIIDLEQILKRRGWWNNGYKKTINYLNLKEEDYIVYSDNPYAVELLRFLSNKGCKIYFDVMDNFAIHPSLNEKEHEDALKGYKEIFKFADCISANSQQTCEFMYRNTQKNILLVKNGVFQKNETIDILGLNEVQIIRKKKSEFKNCVGYIGKLGLRLDADLIDSVSGKCPQTLFVFVGGYLKGQVNKRLLALFESRENIMHVGSVPSAYVYPILNEFDILSIPHAVGKNENGGDPLKLYQYMTRNKPIITTPILGVDEFKEYIYITPSADEWIERIQTYDLIPCNYSESGIFWEDRVKEVFRCLKI